MNRFQKMRKVCKGYLERIPPLLMQGFQWGLDWLREKIMDLGEYLKRNSLRILALNTPYVIIFYLVDKEAWLYQYCQGDSSVERLMVLLLNFQMAFTSVLPSIEKMPLLAGFTGALAVKLLVMMKMKNTKKFRQGEEYGSARWGTAKDIAPFIDPIFENNILLTMTERLTMNSRPKLPKFARNKNVIVIGGSGSGKTRFYVKPNLMQMGKYISYVVTDPKGTIIIECGKMLVRHGYKVKVLNTINFSKSMHYNPFHYIHSEKDILKLVNTIMVNTKGEGEKSSEDFWTKAERLLYCALIGYIWYEAPEEEQNFATLLEFINASETREDDETFKNAVDMLFEELEKEEPEHFAVRQYKKYKLAAGKTAKSILISCGARLAPFDIAELREIMSYDEMELDMMGDQRSALFVIISDTDDTFNFVVAMMYSQLFNLLCDRADDVHHGRLPYHVRILCDEFANIGQIPKFDKLIATIRSREISASIILQSQSQLKTIYKDAAETILGNCDTMLFLGGKESSTLKEISETLGKETIDLYYMLVQMADEFYPVLSARGNTIRLSVGEDMTVYGDSEKLARVFNNILKNAVSYSYENTEIEIGAEKVEDGLKITFRNRGKTIAREKLEFLFEKFFRMDEARATHTGGAGLGLAIAKEIVTLHGGTITAESENEVTTFCVILPEGL